MAFTFRPPPSVSAGWLTCRRPAPVDTDALLEGVLASADHLGPWMPWAHGYDRSRAEEFIAAHTGPSAAGAVEIAPYAVRDQEGRLLGVCGLHARLGPGALEIGYWVDVRHTRRGVASLAAGLMTEVAFGLAPPEEVDRTEIHHDRANQASAAVAQALGYRRAAVVLTEAQAPGESGVTWVWEMCKDDWPTSAGAGRLVATRQQAPAGT